MDLALVESAFDSAPSSQKWNMWADFDQNEKIDVLDLAAPGRYLGHHA